MSGQPSGSGSPPSQPPPMARQGKTLRDRRKITQIPREEDDQPVDLGRNEVKVIKPSDVPERAPLPEYIPPQVPTNIVPKKTPIEQLFEYDQNDVLNVVLPTFVSGEALVQEADRVSGPVGFRSTNYSEKDFIRERAQNQKTSVDEEKTIVVDEGTKDLESAAVGRIALDDVKPEPMEQDSASENGRPLQPSRTVFREAVVDGKAVPFRVPAKRLFESPPRQSTPAPDPRIEEHKKQRKAFIERSQQYIDEGCFGCETRIMNDETLFVIMAGPKESIYERGTFFITIELHVHDYVIPTIRFRTLMVHPSLRRDGIYDNRSLLRNWHAKSTLKDLLEWLFLEIKNLKEIILSKDLPALEDMAQPNISTLAARDWDQFEHIAKKMVNKMAGGKTDKHTTVQAKMSDTYTAKRGWAALDEDEDEEIEIDIEGD